jgi:3-hydroxybutyryl-CoA dehydrogenase
MGMRTIDTVGVVGLGTMGAGIAQVCARAGLRTIGRELTADLAGRGLAEVERRLGREVERGQLTAADRDATLARLSVTDGLDELAGCDLVIEAVIEDLDAKRDLFEALDGQLRTDAILATNTSALSVGEIAAVTRRPERVVGLHFFNPPAVLPLVEVVRAERTADEVADAALAFVRRIGKTPIACRDAPGFVVNRILIPALNDAVRVLEAGTASAEDIDAAMTLGTSWPIGPLALIDLIGVDVHVHAAEALWEACGEPSCAPPVRLRQMLEAGHLGRKSGRGFYEYRS